jgi:hypothetical protein
MSKFLRVPLNTPRTAGITTAEGCWVNQSSDHPLVSGKNVGSRRGRAGRKPEVGLASSIFTIRRRTRKTNYVPYGGCSRGLLPLICIGGV